MPNPSVVMVPSQPMTQKKRLPCSFSVGGQDREGFIPVNQRVHHDSRPHSVGAAIAGSFGQFRTCLAGRTGVSWTSGCATMTAIGSLSPDRLVCSLPMIAR